MDEQDSIPFNPAPGRTLSALRRQLRADRATDSGIRKLRRREREISRGKWLPWTKDTETATVRIILARSAYDEYVDLRPQIEAEVSGMISRLAIGELRTDTRVVQPYISRFRQQKEGAAIVFDLDLSRQLVTVLTVRDREEKDQQRATAAEIRNGRWYHRLLGIAPKRSTLPHDDAR